MENDRFSPFDGPETEYDTDGETPKKRRMSFAQWVLTLFFAVVLAVAAISLIVRPAMNEETVYEAPEEAEFSEAPAITPESTPENTPENTPEAAAPLQTPSAVYVKTSLVADGKVIGTLASREAAEELVSEVFAHYLSLTEPDAEIFFEPELTLINAAQDAEVVGHDELIALFIEDPPVDVVAEISVELTEPIAYKTVTKNDRYLVIGTRVIESMGRDGEQTLTASRKYINGELVYAKDSQATITLEPVDALIRVGVQKVTSKAPDKKQGRTGRSTELEFLPPAKGDIIENFGQIDGVMHLGLDYEAEEGESVFASCAGRVVLLMERGGYGLVVGIDHGDGFHTRYAHLKSASVKAGDTVSAGDIIGTAGMSGNTDKVHLHFELRIDDEAYNPRYYLSD